MGRDPQVTDARIIGQDDGERRRGVARPGALVEQMGDGRRVHGAAVEGPNRVTSSGKVSGMKNCPPSGGDAFKQFNGSNGAKYKDNVQSWSTNEPALDLTATSPIAFARQAAGLF